MGHLRGRLGATSREAAWVWSVNGPRVPLGFCRQRHSGSPCWVKQAEPKGRLVPQVPAGRPGFGMDSFYMLFLILEYILTFYKDSETRDQGV